MIEQIENKLLFEINIDKVGKFYFYDNFMVSEINEGVFINMDIVLHVTECYTEKYYSSDHPFVYIANRINSYSFDPTLHLSTTRFCLNAKGFAVVAYNKLNNKIATIEQNFLNIPSRIFSNMKDAIDWANELTETP